MGNVEFLKHEIAAPFLQANTMVGLGDAAVVEGAAGGHLLQFICRSLGAQVP